MKFKTIKSINERTNIESSAIDVMKNNMQYANEPEVVIFWYNVGLHELFDVYSTPASEATWYKFDQWGTIVRTDRRLHKDIWNKKKRSGDHTMIPRGRVFEFKDGGFKIMIGHWVNDHPEVIDLIMNEFNLPDNTEVVIDSHWDIGHGWSDEH